MTCQLAFPLQTTTSAIAEMLPQHLNVSQGDTVVYHWRDPHGMNTVAFPADSQALASPFGPGVECSETIGDPGTSQPGTLLTNPNALVDSGLLIGAAFDVRPQRNAGGD
jgi:hypothetical protein